MNSPMRMLMAAALITLPMVSNAQKENPRGIYKMMTLTGKLGEVKAPFDQYKICTDSVTLMLSTQNAAFTIRNNDHKIFNYTGDQPKAENDKSALIYDSNADHFTMKWWSQYSNHIHFPNNDWCIEKYEANQFSEKARIIFDMLTATPATDAENPLIGTWRMLGYVDELRDVKKELPNLIKNHPTSKYANNYYVFTPKYWTLMSLSRGGMVDRVEYIGKKAYKVGMETVSVKWLTKDRIAMEEHIDYRTDWIILERMTDGQTMLSRVASYWISEN